MKDALKLNDGSIIEQFVAYDCLIDEYVSWKDGRGQVVRLAEDGRLVVRNSLDEIIFLTEEVHLQ